MHPVTNTAAQTTLALDLSQQPATAPNQDKVRISLRESAGTPQACDKYTNAQKHALL